MAEPALAVYLVRDGSLPNAACNTKLEGME